MLVPSELRSLDAIHLASPEQLGWDLRGFVTYDERLAAAAAGRGFRVIQPARSPFADDGFSRPIDRGHCLLETHSPSTLRASRSS